MDKPMAEQILRQIAASFPATPVPVERDWFSGEHAADYEFVPALRLHILGRPWPVVALDDWRMVGSPGVVRSYLTPEAYLYYLPSLLIGALSEPGFADCALEAILPFNHLRVRRGKWWAKFESAVTTGQRTALLAYAAYLRDTFPVSAESHERVLLHDAVALWSDEG
jgi:hypothetical protein